MIHSPLTKAFLSSMLVHLTLLLSLSSFWGALRLAAPQAELIPAELVTVPQPPPVPESVTTSGVTPLTPPELLSKTDVMVPKLPPPPPEPPVPSKIEPLIPPKAEEKPPPTPLKSARNLRLPRNPSVLKHQSFPPVRPQVRTQRRLTNPNLAH